MNGCTCYSKAKKGILYNEPKARKLGSQLQNGIRF